MAMCELLFPLTVDMHVETNYVHEMYEELHGPV